MVVVQFYPTHYYHDRLTQSELPPLQTGGLLFVLLHRFPVILNRLPYLPGRGRACPGHLDSACSVL
jgi:hypothetical protein